MPENRLREGEKKQNITLIFDEESNRIGCRLTRDPLTKAVSCRGGFGTNLDWACLFFGKECWAENYTLRVIRR